PPNVPSPSVMDCGPNPKFAVMPTSALPPVLNVLPVRAPVAFEMEPIVPSGADGLPVAPNAMSTLPSAVVDPDCAIDKVHVFAALVLWDQVSCRSCCVPRES